MPAHMKLRDKRVIITGGGGEAGLAAAEYFIKEGARVYIFDKNYDALMEAECKITRIAGIYLVDVDDEESVKEGFAGLDSTDGAGVDILVSLTGKNTLNSCLLEAVRRMEKQGQGVILIGRHTTL